MMHNLLFIVIAMFSFGKNENPKMKVANEILAQHIEFQSTHNAELHPIGTGLSAPDKIKSLHVHFVSNKRKKIPEVRKLIVEGINVLINQMNNDSEIRPFLETYPATSKNILYRIAFEEKGEFVESDFIAYVSILDGVIYYRTFDKSNKSFCHVHKETFEEAKEKISNQEGLK